MWPAPSVTRRVIGMIHDIGAVSAAMFLGEAASAPVAAIYLWVTLGNGFRYGNRYLYACTALSLIGFGTVFLLSDYWRQQSSLSWNILVLLAVIPPYVGALLSSLHSARAELRHRATFDALTGLLNRAEFEREAEARLRRGGRGHVMLFCDLDLFKEVNDRAGHAAGDKLLQDVGLIIREQVRAADLCARPGGDEFCVLLDSCPLERGRSIAEAIRNAVAGYRLAWGREYYSVGISIGVAASDAVKDLGSLLRLADAATYAAKNSGRNQVYVIDPRLDGANTQRLRRLYAKGGSQSADTPRLSHEG
jgi:diguanylate cyclase (GGDEF)-like protein